MGAHTQREEEKSKNVNTMTSYDIAPGQRDRGGKNERTATHRQKNGQERADTKTTATECTMDGRIKINGGN